MGLSAVLPAPFLVDLVVQAYTGESGRGPAYAPAVTVRGAWDDTRQLVRTGTTARAQSAGTAYVDLDVVCPPESLVTVPDGRQLKAVAVARLAGGLPVDHLEITLV